MKFRIFFLSILLVIISFHLYSQIPDLYISELLASNNAQNTDPDYNEYSDWLEIYNAGASIINLNGYFITDDPADPSIWKITEDVFIQSNQYLIIWCDNRDAIDQAIHTNFRLSRDGECIALYNSDTTLVDSLGYGPQDPDISFGRNPSDYYALEYYDEPTPGENNGTDGYMVASLPLVSVDAGYYEADQKLFIISKDPAAVVRYTLDGTDPTDGSPIFPDTLHISDRSSEPNVISEIRTNRDPYNWLPDWVPPEGNIFKATVVKLRSFETGKNPSDIITNTYFVKNGMQSRYSLPVISLVVEPDDLFDNNTGIYVPGVSHVNGNSGTGNYFQDWEKMAHITYFDDHGEIGFSQDVGIRIQGGTSPASPQKAFHIIARNRYGDNRMDYPIFHHSQSHARDFPSYKRFIIRAWGSTILHAMFNDALAHRLVEQRNLDLQAYQPAILFINGEYWGLHELREANKSNWYFEVHHGIDTDDPGIDLIYHHDNAFSHVPEVNEGDADQWNAFTNYIHSNDLSNSVHYNYVKTQLDIDNFIEYMVHSIFVVKWDWPGNNDASWRPRISNGKWRYLTFDMEASFGIVGDLNSTLDYLGPRYNMFNHVLEGGEVPSFGTYAPHLVFRELIKNEEFVAAFVSNMEEKLDNEFAPGNTTAILDEMTDQIEPYFEEHSARWPFESNYLNIDWNASIDGIRRFLIQRPAFLRVQLEMFKTGYLSIDENKISYSKNDFEQLVKSLTGDKRINSMIYTLDGRLYDQNEFSKDEFISWLETMEDGQMPIGLYLHTIVVGDKVMTRKVFNSKLN